MNTQQENKTKASDATAEVRVKKDNEADFGGFKIWFTLNGHCKQEELDFAYDVMRKAPQLARSCAEMAGLLKRVTMTLTVVEELKLIRDIEALLTREGWQ